MDFYFYFLEWDLWKGKGRTLKGVGIQKQNKLYSRAYGEKKHDVYAHNLLWMKIVWIE